MNKHNKSIVSSTQKRHLSVPVCWDEPGPAHGPLGAAHTGHGREAHQRIQLRHRFHGRLPHGVLPRKPPHHSLQQSDPISPKALTGAQHAGEHPASMHTGAFLGCTTGIIAQGFETQPIVFASQGRPPVNCTPLPRSDAALPGTEHQHH